jgi:hypothetical protein
MTATMKIGATAEDEYIGHPASQPVGDGVKVSWSPESAR